MFNLEKEADILKHKLDLGQIDLITFNKELEQLTIQSEIYEKNKTKRNKISKVLKRVILLLFLAGGIIYIYTQNHVDKKYEVIDSFKNIPEPIQIDTKGQFLQNVEDAKITINCIASYDISGKVVNTHKYSEYNIINKVSPIDIGICWGKLVDNSKIKYSYGGNRTLTAIIEDRTWYENNGGLDAIQPYFSNNHLIPNNAKTKKLIKAIKNGDYIRIKVFLVTVNVSSEKENGYMGTSTTRNDTGDCCETIYVTDVVWLKENNDI